jgi:hypothetical protein
MLGDECILCVRVVVTIVAAGGEEGVLRCNKHLIYTFILFICDIVLCMCILMSIIQ